ncbi:hypothetical protein GCM10022630_38100 [Thermobifida alba]
MRRTRYIGKHRKKSVNVWSDYLEAVRYGNYVARLIVDVISVYDRTQEGGLGLGDLLEILTRWAMILLGL